MPASEDRDRTTALVALGRALRARGYRFVTVTPETHRRVLARDRRRARDLRDVFGWSRPFERAVVGDELFALLEAAEAIETTPEGHRSRVRFSSLGDLLLAHSAYPTHEGDAVFFGPDTYRFCAAIERFVAPRARVFDVGCGSGAGGLVAAKGAREVVLGDVNVRALALARVNAALAGVEAKVVLSDVMAAADGDFDLVLANPPYMLDAAGRRYRDGGGRHGEALAHRILRECLPRLAPAGSLLLYTGAPIVDGTDVFRDVIGPDLASFGGATHYEELDPDVFGEELDQPGYAAVERIAAVLLIATRS